jgi:glutathione synthase
MKHLKMGFLMDPPEKIKCLEDTSFYIMKRAFEKGHDAIYIDSRHVFALGNRVCARAQSVEANTRDGFKPRELVERYDLESLDLLFIRKDPPFDAHYLYLTHLLELLKGKVPILNDPAGIRSANEKLYALRFPEWIPETCVAQESVTILDFLETVGDAVLKPPCERGGIDIVRVRKKDASKEKAVASLLAKYGTVIAQRFIPAVERGGDKRILVLDGRILGGYVRIPPRGDFRVSVFHDGRYEPASFDERDRRMVESLRPALLADGLYFVGLDVIGGFLSEVNVTSPAGIPESNLFVGRELEDDVVAFLEAFSSRT